ncbi:MAG: FG-GAP repeat protein [Gammaproteobacteria bacterium]|nr:FG-GAP repeat protein [Gammaproteobacteria bacterium]
MQATLSAISISLLTAAGLLFFPIDSASDDLRQILAPEHSLDLASKDIGKTPHQDPQKTSHLTYTVEHQQIVFSWSPVADAHHYRLLVGSASATELSPVPGAENIRHHTFGLRIRHWSIDWADTLYQLQVCRTAKSPCVAVGTASLRPADAAQAVTNLWLPDLRPTPAFDYRTPLALSADGRTMAWSGRIQHKRIPRESLLTFPAHAVYSDAIFISRKTDGHWQPEATIRISEDFSDRSPKAVALSADGHTLAFGSSDFMTKEDGNFSDFMPKEYANVYDVTHGVTGSGAVYIYTRSSGRWAKQAIVTPGKPCNWCDFGASVALSADGRTLAVGDPKKSAFSDLDSSHPDYDKQNIRDHGAVRIYTRIGEVWKQETYLIAPDINPSDRFGISLALSADALTLAVGVPYEDSIARAGSDFNSINNGLADSGAVCVYTHTTETWLLQECLKGADTDYGSLFGASVSLSADGNVLAAGAPGYSEGVLRHHRQWPATPEQTPNASRAGAAYVFARQENAWTQTQKIIAAPTAHRDGFGEAVALSANGHTLAIGAPEEAGDNSGTQFDNGTQGSCPNAGAVYVYTLLDQEIVSHRRLIPPHNHLWNLYGAYIALSDDAGTLAVAAPGWSRPYDFSTRDGDPAEHEKLAQRQRSDLQWIYVY